MGFCAFGAGDALRAVTSDESAFGAGRSDGVRGGVVRSDE